MVTILDTYLDSILEVKKSTFPVRHSGLSPPQETTPYHFYNDTKVLIKCFMAFKSAYLAVKVLPEYQI